MLRMPLKQGEKIQFNNRQYTIESILGDGATCIVYSAYYSDNMGLIHRVNIKECYPFNSHISRDEQALVWESANEKETAFSAFRAAYQKLMLWQNNYVANAFDIFEENQTLYIVMKSDEGVTFDKDNADNLSDILKTVKLLAHVVGNYHNHGYLHLDIKPTNFLVYPRPSEHIILFDMDTITAEEDIKSGKIKCVSYSQSFAAPEQKQGKLKKLCPATDIFAIGAVLFEKIVGRSVESFDLGVFADWEFDGELFENINPKIKRLLRNVFKKTLSANISRRYKATDKLIADLDEAINTIAVGVPYVFSDCPAANANFLGRNNELASIETAFEEGCNTVFLHGFGGIGKSELAKKYAEIHKNKYDSVLFLSYDDSLEDLLENIEIHNFEQASNESTINVLKSVLKKNRVLLIVDNFDVEIDQDDYLDKLLRLNADIIITTRTDFSELSIGNSKQINIENLESKELISLFEKESGIKFGESDRTIVDSILKRYNYYTLIVPILAKQLVASGWSLDALNEKTKQGLKAFENTEKIVIQKDGLPYRKTGLDLMRATFRMVSLSDVQKQVLINLYFLRFVNINKEEYRKYLWKENENRTKHIDAINELLYLGWLKKKHEWQNITDAEIDIHPIIVEMIEVELQPDITKSDMLVAYINGYLPWSDLEQELFEGIDDWGNLYSDEVSHKLKWFCLFALSLDLSNVNNLSFVVSSFSKLINGNIFVFQLIENWLSNKLLDKLTKNLNVINVPFEVQLQLFNLLEVKWAEASIPRIVSSDEKDSEIKENLNQWFLRAYSILGEISTAFRANAIILLCKPVVQLLSQYLPSNAISREVYNIVADFEPQWETIIDDCSWVNWEINFDDNTLEKTEETSNISKNKSLEIILNKDEEEIYYINKYKLGYDVEETALELIEDARFTNHEKANIFDDVTSVVFRNIEFLFKWWDEDACRKQEEFLNKTDWKRFLQMSEQYLKFCQTYNFEENDDVDFDIYQAKQRIAIAKAMIGDESEFIAEIQCVTEDMINMIDTIILDDAIEWKQFTQFYDIHDIGKIKVSISPFFMGIGHYCNILRNLRKNHLILPSLIKCANALECKIKDNYEELKDLIATRSYPFDAENDLRYDVNESGDPMSLMYNWYRNIAEFALNSYLDTGLTNSEYFEIYTRYLKKMKSFTDNSYVFVDYSSRSDKEIKFSRYYCQYETIADICEAYYVNLYKKGIEFEEFEQRICEDKRISPINILSMCHQIAYEEFFEIDRCWTVKGGYSAMKEYLKNNDWSQIEELLCFEENIYLDTEDFEDESQAFSFNSKCDMYRVLLYAIKDDKESFSEYMESLFNDFKEAFDKKKTVFHWSHFTEFEVQHGELRHQGLIGETFYWLDLIECHPFALPYMIKVAVYIHDWLKTLPNYSELMMYSWYKAIAEFAFEDNDATDTYWKYQEKVDKMSGKDYQENLDSIIE